MNYRISRWLYRLSVGKAIPAKAMAILVSLGLVGTTAVCAIAYKEPTPPPKHESSYVPPPPKPAPEVCVVPKKDNCPPVIHNVPDAGSTLALMGIGITALGGLSWKRKM